MKTTTVVKNYRESAYIESRGCNAILFVNQGETDCILQGIIKIASGDSLQISQVGTEAKDMTQYFVTFEDNSATNDLVVIQIGVI